MISTLSSELSVVPWAVVGKILLAILGVIV